ncbi:diguanylate cyclase/phosphodiesterase [Rhodopseudomonas thermotolerans]|uniref:Diguanylate cyclase/phosphodiesterase n=2 Tax=Rhodopseudomonas TaxID=1073 RepID=A0A336JN84_9BRAD|nr:MULTISPECIES: EAL domain-containing protein [Rhodopseudomonas]RED34419.1 diguanylate cyclase/phosphodiesterase [Rhodopseudomonas pentothenatexigens]REG02615.1 diguanylate cyclase/phosphodiesterase [Rhodopseudomonas thermotolerans]SSW91088.1 diguanylate cyclase/phosphodiesterase [Rhodopseudomonas pentothenatexigens]
MAELTSAPDAQFWEMIALAAVLCVLGVVGAYGGLRSIEVSDGKGRRRWIVATGFASLSAIAAAMALALMVAWDAPLAPTVALGLMIGSVTATTGFASLAVWLSSIAGRRTRLTLAERDMVLDGILNDAARGFCLFDAQGRLQLWNEAFLDIYAIPPGREIAGHSLRRTLAVMQNSGNFVSDKRQLIELGAALASGGPATLVAELRDGRHIRIDLRRLPNGGWIAKHSDVTDHKQAEQRFAYLALHDVATGLPNRAAFNERIVASVEQARRFDGGFAVIRLGIDRFKEINDVFGQAVGDAVLAEMARRLADTCHWGFLARPGGDEFSIVTSPDPATDSIQEVCRQLARLCDTEFEVDGHRIRLTATAGVSVYPRDGEDADTLLAHADVALYRAKTEQRGTVCLFEPAMDLQIREKRALQRELAVALEQRQFEIHYQPQATAAGAIIGFEALLRWRHPVRGMVSPALFVPLAEETGQIGPIDEWVLRSACAEAASWSKPLAIAVNFSPLDFRRLDVPALILQILLETGLEPSRLEVEITEGVLIDDFAGAIAILRKIKNLGVRVAMDDFGAGYSSLSYLQSFPFDKIKIDQAFTRKLETNPESAAIVEAILSLARTLKLPVIAEGVETESQLAFLARAGCDEVQGYLIGRPQPITHFRDIIAGATVEPPPLARAG